MRTVHRSLSIALLALAFLVACGDDEEAVPTTNPTTTSTVGRAASSTTVPATVAQAVTDGATCQTAGARGTTQAGLPMVCTQVAGGSELRWRPA